MKGAESNPTISNASSCRLKWELGLLLSKWTWAEVLPKSQVMGFLIPSSLWGLRGFLSCCITYMHLNARHKTNYFAYFGIQTVHLLCKKRGKV